MSCAPRLLIRCDAGAHHGFGHLSRCLNIAVHAREAKLTVRFVCQAPDEILLRIRSAGFDVTPVENATGSDDPNNWMFDDVDFLLVDSKEMDARYIERLSSRASVICIDDEVARDLPCRAVINNNIWARASDYHRREGRDLWLGPKYNTIHPAYFGMAADRREGLLISLGGEDPHDHTSWLVHTLRDLIASMPVHVCIGPAHPAQERAIALCREAVPDAVIHRAPSSLIEPISHCSLALTAGGTTCYELAAAGVAMAVLAVEDHQVTMRDALVRHGAALSLGTHADLGVGMARQVMLQLREPALATKLAQSAKILFNSSGITHIVQEIKDLPRCK